jgi:hypothetical protein
MEALSRGVGNQRVGIRGFPRTHRIECKVIGIGIPSDSLLAPTRENVEAPSAAAQERKNAILPHSPVAFGPPTC